MFHLFRKILIDNWKFIHILTVWYIDTHTHTRTHTHTYHTLYHTSMQLLFDNWYFNGNDLIHVPVHRDTLLKLITFSFWCESPNFSVDRVIVEKLAADIRQLFCSVSSSRMPILCSLSIASTAAVTVPRLSIINLCRFFSVLTIFWFWEADANWPVRGRGIIVAVEPRLRRSGSPPPPLFEDSLRPGALPPLPSSCLLSPLASWSQFSPGISQIQTYGTFTRLEIVRSLQSRRLHEKLISLWILSNGWRSFLSFLERSLPQFYLDTTMGDHKKTDDNTLINTDYSSIQSAIYWSTTISNDFIRDA